MTGILYFLYSRRHLLIYATALMVACGVFYWGYSSGNNAARQEWQLKWVLRDQKEAADIAHLQLAIRNKEQQLAVSLSEVNENAQNKISLAHATSRTVLPVVYGE
jgi:hypothetical protein